MKFMFPNQFNVYLHDTPADSLFARASRSFSHGCVRLEQPEKLAEYVLRDQPDWTSERISEAMHGGRGARRQAEGGHPGLPGILDGERDARSAGAVPQGRLRNRRPADRQVGRTAGADEGERIAADDGGGPQQQLRRQARGTPVSDILRSSAVRMEAPKDGRTASRSRGARRDRRASTGRRRPGFSPGAHGRQPTPR